MIIEHITTWNDHTAACSNSGDGEHVVWMKVDSSTMSPIHWTRAEPNCRINRGSLAQGRSITPFLCYSIINKILSFLLIQTCSLLRPFILFSFLAWLYSCHRYDSLGFVCSRVEMSTDHCEVSLLYSLYCECVGVTRFARAEVERQVKKSL
jgi:hypothetical protein